MIGRARLVLALLVGGTSLLPAQTYEIYKQFSGTGATDPRSPLIQGTDGALYGTTMTGGSGACNGGGFTGCGTIFRIDTTGKLDILHEFTASEGRPTRFALVRASDGNLYGTTDQSNTQVCPCGTVYRVDDSGDFTPVHTFQGDDGRQPCSALIEAAPGDLWGTTCGGGSDQCAAGPVGCGTVFRMHFDGGLATMHSLNDEDDDEGYAPDGTPVLATDGNLYGTTLQGGAELNGTFYRITLNGNWTTIAPLPGEGYLSNGLIQDTSGNFIGTTFRTGPALTGSVFRLSPTGQFDTLHSLAEDQSEGYLMFARVLQAEDGNYWGVAFHGGAQDRGTVFRMDDEDFFEVVHEFDAAPDGAEPQAPLLQGADGNLYGVALSETGGLVFRIVLAPPPQYFCPTSPVRRDQMAVFLLKLVHGAAFTPPACAGEFGDVACPGLFADWIEQLAAEGVTAGCAGGNYCPLAAVTRAQMAVFLLKTEHGPAYTPPDCQGLFPDVPCPSLFAPWIEQLASEGITGGCAGGNFCPDSPVTRAQMSVFLLKSGHGGSYVPPACQSQFGDVVCPSLYADWIEQLYAEHITAGCAGPS